jgi:transcriptional regulator with XRE-family HTH domain
MNKYGLRLKQLREQNGYSQEELAKLLNTSRSRIGMYEQGRRQPDFEMQEAIADLFNVTIDYLFGRKDEELLEADNVKALELYHQYQNLSPENRIAFETLLKNLQS